MSGMAAIRMSITAISLVLLAQPALAQEPSRGESGSGSDIVRPPQRIDLRTEVSGKEDGDEAVFTLRYTRPQPIGDGWQVNLRADLPFSLNSSVTPDNPGGNEHFGLGDVLLHAVLVRHVGDRDGFGIGTQLIMPTAEEQGFGKGKWRLRPTVGYRWGIPSVSEGTFFQLLARYDFSFAGDDDRSRVSELQFSPNLEIALPGDAYVSFFPSADIRYNFVRDDFFLPANLEVGKQFGRVVGSREGGAKLIGNDKSPYDWKLEGRVGLRF